MASNLKQQRVGVTSELLDLIQVRVKQLGITSIPEYFRYLAHNDVKVLVDPIPMVDIETEKRIAQSLKDHEDGNVIRVNNAKELTELMDQL